jgi:hypothetical protein
MSAIIEMIDSQPVNVRTGCICSNHGRPVGGIIYVNPCCRVHYAEVRIPFPTLEQEASEEEKAEWRRLEKRPPAKKRVAYPKMTVARQ